MGYTRAPLWFYAAATAVTLAAAAVGWAGSALAQPATNCADMKALPGAVSTMFGGDTVVLAPHETATAQWCYWNANPPSSNGGVRTLTVGNLTVTFRVRIGIGTDAEQITVAPPEGYMVLPLDADQAAVPDGEGIVGTIHMGLM
jgi:hypothetical protein